MEKRACKRCAEALPLDSFRRHVKKGVIYYEYKCIACTREVVRLKHIENREADNARLRKKYWDNVDAERAKARAWYDANRRSPTGRPIHDGPVETVEFNGYRYRRYPESDNPAHRRYFSRAGARLHRDVWEYHHGPIPEGYQVHHIDENTANNDIANLECLTFAEHRALHHDEYVARGRSEEFLKHLAEIRPAAADWHRSPAGKEWHRQHAESLRGRKKGQK